MNREEVKAELIRVAELLQTTSLSISQFQQHGRIHYTTASQAFGSWNKAIIAAGLSPNLDNVERMHSEDEILIDIIRVARKLGKRPTKAEVSANGGHSHYSFRKYWHNWGKACLAAFEKFGADLPEDVARQFIIEEKLTVSPLQQPIEAYSEHIQVTPKQVAKTGHGYLLNFRNFIYPPESEQGVVFLFAIVSAELGFSIESIQLGFPDCVGRRYDVERKKWKPVRIEFEYKSSNYDHPVQGCDLIVCWIHDWRDCPLDVIELKSKIMELPSS